MRGAAEMMQRRRLRAEVLPWPSCLQFLLSCGQASLTKTQFLLEGLLTVIVAVVAFFFMYDVSCNDPSFIALGYNHPISIRKPQAF
jgi:hypothetical protein